MNRQQRGKQRHGIKACERWLGYGSAEQCLLSMSMVTEHISFLGKGFAKSFEGKIAQHKWLLANMENASEVVESLLHAVCGSALPLGLIIEANGVLMCADEVCDWSYEDYLNDEDAFKTNALVEITMRGARTLDKINVHLARED